MAHRLSIEAKEQAHVLEPTLNLVVELVRDYVAAALVPSTG